jgi:hypothetical protein
VRYHFPALLGLRRNWASVFIQLRLAQLPHDWHGRMVRKGWEGESLLGYVFFRRWLSRQLKAMEERR